MLTHTFLHIKGVGRSLERTLWEAGVTSWRRAKAFCRGEIGPVPGVGTKKRRMLADAVAASEARLAAGDARFFHERLPASERWRMAHEFRHRLALVDIETTGMGPRAETTVVGVYAGGEARLFVRDTNLPSVYSGEFRALLEAHDVWVSYNGVTFDEPFLRREFGEPVRPAAHIDLRYCLRAVGLTGGLKAVERLAGIKRPARLAELDGWDAVRLWNEYKGEGRPESLRTLVEYNMEDVVNLEPLLDVAVSRHIAGLSSENGLPFTPEKGFEARSSPASREKATREAVAEVGRLTGHW